MSALPDSATPEIQNIYRQLAKGLGHELVTDDNVFALIDLAKHHGHELLARELKEWQAPCSTPDDRPRTFAPTGGFNKEHVKH
ncbi:hypothetical protein [Aquabacterium sp.]|uniref:hypothetical protein n=1 Tax=Aquabacterium sp. TaxID=1872578 RepID=UPI003D6D9BA8